MSEELKKLTYEDVKKKWDFPIEIEYYEKDKEHDIKWVQSLTEGLISDEEIASKDTHTRCSNCGRVYAFRSGVGKKCVICNHIMEKQTTEPLADPTIEPMAEPTTEPMEEPMAEPSTKPRKESTGTSILGVTGDHEVNLLNTIKRMLSITDQNDSHFTVVQQINDAGIMSVVVWQTKEMEYESMKKDILDLQME